MFSTLSQTDSISIVTFNWSYANAFNFDKLAQCFQKASYTGSLRYNKV